MNAGAGNIDLAMLFTERWKLIKKRVDSWQLSTPRYYRKSLLHNACRDRLKLIIRQNIALFDTGLFDKIQYFSVLFIIGFTEA